eukprot:3003163-Rhodomonas_salina.1
MVPRYVFFRLYQKLYERLCVASRLAEEQQQRQEEDAIKVEKKDEDEEDGNEDEEGKEGEGKEGKGRSKVYNRFMAMLTAYIHLPVRDMRALFDSLAAGESGGGAHRRGSVRGRLPDAARDQLVRALHPRQARREAPRPDPEHHHRGLRP